MLDILQREAIYLWYYFSVQLEQIFGYWVLGMVLGSAISVFAKDKLHGLFQTLCGKRLGALGVIPASLLGIVSPLCMYGTIPIAASFSRQGMRHDWLAAFMMSSILLNPQLIFYSAALGPTALWVRIISCCICGAVAGWLVGCFFPQQSFFDFTSFDDPVSRDVDPSLLIRFLKNLGRNIKVTGPMFLLGVALSALFQRYVPAEWVGSFFGENEGYVCMESTGKYWIPVYNILETTCTIVLAHPKYVKAIRGKKTDKKDAKWIADIFKHDLVSGSFIPPADIRQLRDLMRYHWKLTSFTTGEKNRAQNCLTVSNIKLDDVFSDVFGKAATAITTRLLENNKPFDVTPYLNKHIKTPVETIQAAVDGEMCAEQAEKLRIIRSHMGSLELCKLNLQSLILTTAEKYLPQLNIVATAPGIQVFSAIGVISEIGVDMSVFPTSKHLCSWAGLTPQNNESAGKKKTTRISRAGAYIKPLIAVRRLRW